MSTQWAAPFGTQTPAAYNNVALGLIYNGVSSRSLRHPSAADRDVHRATAPFGTQTPAAGFAPPTRHARPLIFSPHATHRRLISSYKFLLSPSLLPVAAPIALRSARSAIAQRAPGGLLLIPFRSTAARLQRAFFFIFRFCPFSPLRPPPFRHPPPWRCPVRRSAAVPPRPPPRSPRNPDCAAVSASIHPLHSPHRPCPKIIVLRSASL